MAKQGFFGGHSGVRPNGARCRSTAARVRKLDTGSCSVDRKRNVRENAKRRDSDAPRIQRYVHDRFVLPFLFSSIGVFIRQITCYARCAKIL